MKIDLFQALASTRVALLGEVRPSLRAVTIIFQKEPTLLELNYYYEGFADEEYLEDLSCVSTEATAGVGAYEIQNFIQYDLMKPLPEDACYAYCRYEKNLPNIKKSHLQYEHFIPIQIINAMGEALLGRVTPELTYVYGDIVEENSVLLVHFYHDKPITHEIKLMWEEAAKETSVYFAAFPHTLDCKIISSSTFTERLESCNDPVCAYRRKGVYPIDS